jgi:hypothetical protein
MTPNREIPEPGPFHAPGPGAGLAGGFPRPAAVPAAGPVVAFRVPAPSSMDDGGQDRAEHENAEEGLQQQCRAEV